MTDGNGDGRDADGGEGRGTTGDGDGDGDGGEGGGGDDGPAPDGARSVPVGVVDAFAAEPLAGVPVGVVPDAGGIGAGRRRALAAELGGRGTAFVAPPDGADADRRLRYVPPDGDRGRPPGGAARTGDEGGGERGTEVADGDGPGTGTASGADGSAAPPIRATVAAVARLLSDGRVDPGPLVLDTAAGAVEAEATDEGAVWVAAGDASVDPVDLDYDRAGTALGVAPAALRDVGADMPAAVASVTRPFLVVPVNFLERLSGADPDRAALADLADAHGVAGVYPVTFDALDAALHARSFPAAPDAPEDPVTAAAAGAAGAYLHAVEAFDGDPPDELRVEQGHFVDRPGVVRVRLADDGVWVGGRTAAALDGRAALPAADDDDILVA
ncbi:MAG: PhzF family phenazine biosynthesis protein [Haloferacaceae archaeon]